jgi:AraC family transcriptional regulator
MQTRVSIDRVGTDVPRHAGRRSYGPAGSASHIGVLNGFARDFAAANRDGAFSLKWIPRGAARYQVDRVQHRLAGDKVLLLQAGQPYEVEFLDRRGGSESFCLFFSPALLGEASVAWEEIGGGKIAGEPCFADMVFTPPVGVLAALRGLRCRLDDVEAAPERLEEVLLSLLLDLAAIRCDHERLVARLPVKRARTRRLLLGRLQRAREMIEDHRGRPPSLETLAQTSCLSRFHFLRLFKTVFGASPMAYAERCRIERGRNLLRHTPLSVAEVAGRLGYESQSAFAKAFRRHVGMTPRLFRDG